jgi:hypothetical protein
MFDFHKQLRNQCLGEKCFLLATVDEIVTQGYAQGNLSFIPSMITPLADGTENVKLYQPITGIGPWAQIQENVTNVFYPTGVNSSQVDIVGNQKEIWPQVIEKAYAQLEGGYSAIANGGWPTQAMAALTGEATWSLDPTAGGGITLAQMMAYANNNDLITLDTKATSDLLPYGLDENHAYAFAGFAGSSIKLQNPWGYDNPAPIPIAALASGAAGIDQIDLGHFNAGAGHSVPQGAGEPLWVGT